MVPGRGTYLAWLNHFRRLRVRHEQRPDVPVFLTLACLLICWKFHKLSSGGSPVIPTMYPEQILVSHKGVYRYGSGRNYRLLLWLVTEREPDSSAGHFTVDWEEAERRFVAGGADRVRHPHLPRRASFPESVHCCTCALPPVTPRGSVSKSS
jgi:hypothetical protein